MAWGLSPSKYIVQAVKNCQINLNEKLNWKYLSRQGRIIRSLLTMTLQLTFLTFLDPECLSFYQHLIGVMRWMVELGGIDIATKIFILSSHLVCPCKGHLENALHVMGYLKLKHNSRLIFDPTYPDIDQNAFPTFEWTEFYGNR
jgi:hypothetical protein